MIWFGWFLTVFLNACLFVWLLLCTVRLSLWPVVLVLLALEGVPLLWFVGVIPSSLFVTDTFIGGWWVVVQLSVLVMEYVFLVRLSLGTGMLLVIALFFIAFFIIRTRVMADFLFSKNRKEVVCGKEDGFKSNSAL